jgi:predicted dehydrogenase
MTKKPDRQAATRRNFLRASALISAAAWAASRGAWADPSNPTSRSPNEQIDIACIGVGGKGASDSNHAALFGNIVAICDIDDKNLEQKAVQFPKARKFNDYRKMFDAMGKSFDAVTVSTPDHHHAIAAMLAIKAGKHVYCQKPLTHKVAEARALRLAARKYKVVTQMGNQGTATSEFRRGVELLRAGIIGNVTEVHVWTNRPIWPQAPVIMSRPPGDPVPAHVHWDEWIGPAPMRPYSGVKQKNGQPFYHQANWKGWWDFGCGALGDMGCHTANLPFMGLDLGYPSSIQAMCGDPNPETYPSWATIEYHFPARGDKPPVKLTWWEGHKGEARNLPKKSATQGFDLPTGGSMLIGDKGTMFSINDYGSAQKLIFTQDSEGFTNHVPITLPRLAKPGEKFDNDAIHKAEWLAAVRNGTPSAAMANFDHAGMLSEFILLGNAALRACNESGESPKLEWDGPGMQFTDAPVASAHLTKSYRAGWGLEGV